MKKRWIFAYVVLACVVILFFIAIPIVNDRNARKTEFKYVCHVDSGNLPCEFSWGGLDHKRVGWETQWISEVELTEEGIVFNDISYDGELPIDINCYMDFIMDGETVSCGLLFRRTEECSDKEWKGEIFLDIVKRGDIYEVSPRVTNCRSVELGEYRNNSAGQGYDFYIYQ